ncbi:MAG: hypothetical protein LWW93_05355 [Hyphomicrobiales bacterium]|nr:hypothetical protein [Hyphomicrobiales bacterium]
MTMRLLADPAAHRPNGRPLLVVDVDEVVLGFIAPLSAFLERHGFQLMPRSFAITGNVTRAGGGQAIGGELVRELIAAFFAREVENQPPVEGAIATLARLAAATDPVLLTNVPAAQAARRAAHLAELGVGAPMIANDGPKGPALARLAQAARAVGGDELPVIFVDDGPNHLASARGAVAGVRLVHFVADPVWFAMAPTVGGTWLKTRDWDAVEAAIRRLLDGDEPGAGVVETARAP